MHDLTWADLEAWAGAKILSRGTSYQKSGYVKNLSVTHDGSLLAWVRGSENYATTVSMMKGRLSSGCTCPYGGTCKHAVAVVLEYLDQRQKNAKISLAEEDDERLLLLEDTSSAPDDDDDLQEDDEVYDFSNEDDSPPAGADFKSFLRKKSKKELESTLSGILKDHPELTKELGFAPRASGKKGCDALAKAVTKSIVVLSGKPGWRNYWRHEGYTPDYTPVGKGLQKLLDQGCADDVVKLGEKLFTRGTEQIEQSDDEGETAEEIARTMPMVFKALAKCSLPDTDKLERAVDFGLRDQYGLCRGLDEFLHRKFGEKTWSDLADRLLARLKDMKPDKQDDAFFRSYRRDNLSNDVIRALENAGRGDEAVAICFQEAEATGSYERLVRKLRSSGRTAEAEEWIRKGVKATRDKWPGIASSLKNELREIRQQKRDWPFVAALRADDFFEDPGLKTFKDLQKACEKARVGPEVRNACMTFLETGAYPVSKSGWPLPDTGFGKREKPRREKPPFTDVLIDIAMDEKRIDEVWRWYEVQKQKANDWFGARRNDEVATAIAPKYPERAIAIWKKIAEWHIAQTNVGAYGEAVTYLKKVRKAFDGIGKSAEWSVYLSGLTEANKRKTRLVQMLNVLKGKPILSKG
jgi:uncharacterized Zn finger protein